MNLRTRERLTILSIVAAFGAIVGWFYVVLLSRILSFELTFDEGLLACINGAMIAGILTGFELFYVPSRYAEWLRRLPFVTGLLARAGITAVIIITLLVLDHRVITPDVTYPYVNLVRDTLFSFVAFLFIHFIVQTRRLVGGRVLTNFIAGRYHRPVREERIFLFLDMVGSTAIAERLGDIGTHALISRLFFDLDEPVNAHRGEVHRYIGDAMVVTWPIAEGTQNSRCVRCCFAMRDRISARADWYLSTFGVVPEIRVGLHGGPVIAGECGDRKQEIVYFGDTVNTAARIEQSCKALGHPLLVSGELLAHMTLPADINAESMGEISLRGRQKGMELYSLVRAVAT